MSVNTIKLSTVQGDIYISPQQTTTYKGITLFGYGYLDWGTVINQSIVTLMDKLDSIEDSGLSEIEFDLSEYEENQKILRAQEFNLWKSGFTDQLKILVEEYTSPINEQIVSLLEAQDKINKETQTIINDNYTEVKNSLNELTENLNQTILDVVNSQISSILTGIEELTTIVESTKSSLESATSTLNETKLLTEQSITNFKKEFLIIFEKFKDDTNKALIDNKDYLVKYINEALAGVSTVTAAFEERILALESISGSLDASKIQQIIINKVNEIAEGIIVGHLSNFSIRIENLEDKFLEIDEYIDTKVNDSIEDIRTSYDSKLSTINNSLETITPKVNKNTQDLVPLNKLMFEVNNTFEQPEDSIKQIMSNMEQIVFTYSQTNCISQNYKDLLKNILENLLNQLKYHIELNQSIHNDNFTNLIEGFRNTAFDELSLIKRQANKNLLKTNGFNLIKNSLYKYSSQNFKFTLLTEDFEKQYLYFAFKLPYNNNLALWKTLGLKIKNLRTNEEIVTQYFISDSHFVFKDVNFYGDNRITDVLVPEGKVNPFIYCLNNNGSQVVKIKFPNGYELEDTLKFTFYTSAEFTTEIDSKEILVSDIRSDNYAEPEYREIFFPQMMQESDSIMIPTLEFTNPVLDIQNTKLLIPVNKIITTQSGTKEFNIKIGLPKNATLTNISFNDGTTTQTKTFTNHDKFPLTEEEYTTRNLGSTNNYYKDICTTGLLYFPINSAAKLVKTTITYVTNGVTKTENITSGGAGLDLGKYSFVYDSIEDELELKYDGDIKYTFNKTGEFTANGNIFAYSDERLKKDIVVFDRELDIDKIGTYLFKYLDSDNYTIGFIAQEIEKQLPELITYDKVGNLKLNYDGMIPILFNLLKRSKEKEKDLEERITKIEKLLNIN